MGVVLDRRISIFGDRGREPCLDACPMLKLCLRTSGDPGAALAGLVHLVRYEKAFGPACGGTDGSSTAWPERLFGPEAELANKVCLRNPNIYKPPRVELVRTIVPELLTEQVPTKPHSSRAEQARGQAPKHSPLIYRAKTMTRNTITTSSSRFLPSKPHAAHVSPEEGAKRAKLWPNPMAPKLSLLLKAPTVELARTIVPELRAEKVC